MIEGVDIDNAGNLAPQGCGKRRVPHREIAIISDDEHIAPEKFRVCGDEFFEMAARLLFSFDEYLSLPQGDFL